MILVIVARRHFDVVLGHAEELRPPCPTRVVDHDIGLAVFVKPLHRFYLNQIAIFSARGDDFDCLAPFQFPNNL